MQIDEMKVSDLPHELWSQPIDVPWLHWPTERQRSFTSRHVEILRELARGYSNKEIGKALRLSPETVKHHIKRLFRKLGVSKRKDAVAEAHRRAVID